MGITAGVALGAGEIAADVAVPAAVADLSAMTVADVALPAVTADIAAGTYAFAPEALAATDAALGTAAGAAGTAAGEGSLLGPGFSSVADLGVGTGAAPIATGTEALAGGAGSTASTLAGTTAGAPLSGVSSAIGSSLPAGVVPDTGLATDLAATGGPAQLGGESSLASQSVLQPTQIAGNAVGEGSQGFTAQEITQGAAQGGNVASQAGSQGVMQDLGVQEAGLQQAPANQLAQNTATMTDASKTIGQNAVTQTPTAYNSAGNVPSMAQGGAPTAAPAVPEVTAAPTPAATTPAAQAGTSVGEGSSGLSASDITAGKATTGASQAAGSAGAEGFGSSIVDYVKKNPSLLLSGAGLLGNMLMGQQPPKFQPQVNAAAQQMTAQGQQLASYLSTGTLPPGVQASLNSARDAALAAVKSQHAARGTSGSSMEAQDMQRINDTIVSQGASIATNLLNAGVSEQQMAAGIYQNLMQTSMAQDQQMSNAIAGFTNALAYGAARNPTPV